MATTTPEPRSRHGRTWAYAGLIFGSSASVAANVGHAFLRPAHIAPRVEWRPQPGAIAWGLAVAVALLISVEVLARIDWPASKGWYAVRYAGGGIVALVAAGTSYRHLSDLLAHWHETLPVVYGGPAIVDGLMILCSFALMVPDTTTTAHRPHAPDRIASLREDPIPHAPIHPPIPSQTTEAIPFAVPTRDPLDPPPGGAADPHAPRAPGGSGRSPDRGERGAGRLQPRPGDLARARAAITAGELPAAPTAKALREHLNISPNYARATRDALRQAQPPSPALIPEPDTPPAIPEQPATPIPKPSTEYATPPPAQQ